MPYPGYRSVSLREAIVERLTEIAEETHRTVPQVIEYMLDRIYPKIKKEAA